MKFSFLYLCLFFTLSAWGQVGYPTPPPTDKMLFYLQRSHNKNTIIYDINTLPDGSLDKDNPIKIYWIRYEEDGRKAELSYIQKKAFGIQHKLVDKAKGSIVLQFNKFKNRDIFLFKSSSGKYQAYMKINNELAEFTSAYLNTVNNSLGIPITVKYIEFNGISSKNKKNISETYIP